MPIPWLALAAGGAGLGLLKSELIDKPNEEKDRIMQSITDRYSPWTQMRGKAPERANPIGDMAAMGAQGAALGQGINSAQSQDAINSALASKLGAKGGADAMTAAAVSSVKGTSPSSDFQVDPSTSIDPDTLKILRIAMNNRRLSGLA